MNSLGLGALIVGGLGAAIAGYYGYQKMKRTEIKLFSGNGAFSKSNDGLVFTSKTQTAKTKVEIDNAMNQSTRLQEILKDEPNKEGLIEQIMSDTKMVEKIKNSKTKEDLEKSLLEWINKRRKEKKGSNSQSETKKIIEKKTSEQENKKIEKIDQTAPTTQNKEIKNDKNDNALSQKQNEMLSQIHKKIIEGELLKLLEILKNMDDKEIEEILQYYQKIQVKDPKKNSNEQILENAKSKKELVEFLKNELIKNLTSRVEDIKQLVSKARKKGFEVKNEEMALMSIPQKIKMFRATMEEKDFNKVNELLNSVNKQITEKISTPSNSSMIVTTAQTPIPDDQKQIKEGLAPVKESK